MEEVKPSAVSQISEAPSTVHKRVRIDPDVEFRLPCQGLAEITKEASGYCSLEDSESGDKPSSKPYPIEGGGESGINMIGRR